MSTSGPARVPRIRLVEPDALSTRIRAIVERAVAAGMVARSAVAPAADLAASVATARGGVEHELGKASSRPRIRELCALLTELDEAQRTLEAHERSWEVRELGRIRTAVEELRGLDAAAVIAAAPRELCAYLDFGRAMVSSVEQSVWLPGRVHYDPELGAETTPLVAYIAEARIPLQHTMLETEVVRRQIATVVPDVRDEPGIFPEIVDAARTSAYITAPVSARGRAIGLFHVDRPRSGAPLEVRDRDRVAAFTSCFALVYEQAVLRHQLQAQRERAHDTFRRTEELLARIEEADLELRDAQRMTVAPEPATGDEGTVPPPSAIVDGLLTAREREVVALMATGATNLEIGKRLVISEGTVKCHVGHILGKLRAPSRAAAIAKYARITQRHHAA
ncbi:LuxR C-terminal-related transcriptional regulator [Patulibacter sp. NPDC049589]|uniref:helix-turn-helix transcriptional regulator n=1 Tax=Patulibacter sp. NPDC049589 TaxID=3154731 RepID=UPI00344671CE